MDGYERIWESVLAIMERDLTPINIQTWIKPLKISRIETSDVDIVYIDICADKGRDLIYKTVKNRFLNSLNDAFNEVMMGEFRVILLQESEENNYIEEQNIKSRNSTQRKKPKKKLDQENILNPKYTFDNFIVGSSNRYAYAAALAVAESPSDAYNPLFIYGGSGLGKTHLIQAIGIHILEKYPDKRVLYTDTEMFTNEMVKAILEKKTGEFKSKYRDLDVLIIDDIQFLEGKESTQEEFFWTFNNLYSSSKQIIISSDRPPNKLVNLNDRLKSRFSWNLIADIQPPDYETRIAILRKKAEIMNIEIDSGMEDVISYIAEKVKDNIREMEGTFNSTVSLAKLVGDKPDRALAKRVLRNISSAGGELQVTPEKIKKVVCKFSGIKISDLESSKKSNNIAFPRQVCMYLIRELTDSSLEQIGKYFGGKHHTTVKYACEKIESDIKVDSQLREFIEKIKTEIKE